MKRTGDYYPRSALERVEQVDYDPDLSLLENLLAADRGSRTRTERIEPKELRHA